MSVCMTPVPVIFDLDGTLIDSAPDIHACVNLVLRDYRIGPLTLIQVRGMIGGGVDVLWQKIVRATRANPADQRGMLASFMTRYHGATRLTRIFSNVEMALGVLADRGHPLGICTNKPRRPTESVLDHFGIAHLFGEIICGDSLPEKKPDPAPLIAAMTGLGANPDNPQAIYVGDSEFDATCAAAASVPFLIYTRGYRRIPVEELPHSAAFDEFDQLPALVEELTGA